MLQRNKTDEKYIARDHFAMSSILCPNDSPAAGSPSGSEGEPGCTHGSPGRPASGNPRLGSGCTHPLYSCMKRSTRWTPAVKWKRDWGGGGGDRERETTEETET